MPYHFDFDSANRIIRCQFEGQVTDEEFKEYYREAPKYVALTSPLAGIADFSEVSAFEVTPETLRELARSTPIMPDPILPRFVVAPSPLIFGFARMFQILGEETRPNLHVVKTSDEAFEMLGAEKPKFEPIAVK